MRLTCPRCGSHELFAVQVVTWVDVDRDGAQEFDAADAPYAEPCNNDLAATICRQCGHQGTLGRFRRITGPPPDSP